MLEVIAIKRLRYIGITEGISSLLLFFVAMPLKYFMGLPEVVSLVGMVHGILFMLYLILLIHSAVILKRSLGWSAKVLVASIFPFGPFIIEPGLRREQRALMKKADD